MTAPAVDVGGYRAEGILGGLVIRTNDKCGGVACLYPGGKFILLVSEFIIDRPHADELQVSRLAIQPIPKGRTEVQTVISVLGFDKDVGV